MVIILFKIVAGMIVICRLLLQITNFRAASSFTIEAAIFVRTTVLKVIVNIFFLLIVLLTSLPVKHASRLFFKKQAQQEICDDSCDAPEKKADDTVGFKEYPCSRHYGVNALHPVPQRIITEIMHVDWQLPLRPAVEIHTPPPNKV